MLRKDETILVFPIPGFPYKIGIRFNFKLRIITASKFFLVVVNFISLHN